MVYIFCALYHEASQLISHYHLKRDDSYTTFQVFSGGSITLAITGVGKNAASVCVSHVLTRTCANGQLAPEDMVISYGCAGGLDFSIGELYQISRIQDSDNGRWYYPDLFLATDLPLAPLVSTGMVVTVDETESACSGFLYDMEGSAVFSALSYFGGPHQILLCKVVSDPLSPESLDIASLREQLDRGAQQLVPIIDGLLSSGAASAKDSIPSYDVDSEDLIRAMHLSVYQSRELKNLLQYCSISNIPVAPVVSSLQQEALLPAENKKKGTMVFELFKSRLLQSVR